jgi:hypothetical protein
MGLSRVDGTRWLLRDEQFDEYLALKRSLLSERHDEVFQALPASEAASQEILEAIDAGFRGLLPRVHPLERAALLVQEDLCVLLDGVFVAGCVCFPSHWRLVEKIGQPTAALHGPVHGYDRELAAKVDTFIERLTPDHIAARRNFTIHERPDLFAPECPSGAEVPPADQWLRSEYETLRRFPRTGAVLFTIRTQQTQLKHVDQAVRVRLADRLRAEPEPLIGYRNLTGRLPALIDWLCS